MGGAPPMMGGAPLQMGALPAPAPAGTMATNLSEVLSASRLLHYEDALRELGCTQSEVLLRFLEEADLVEIGMKKIEIKRLQHYCRGGSE